MQVCVAVFWFSVIPQSKSRPFISACTNGNVDVARVLFTTGKVDPGAVDKVRGYETMFPARQLLVSQQPCVVVVVPCSLKSRFDRRDIDYKLHHLYL